MTRSGGDGAVVQMMYDPPASMRGRQFPARGAVVLAARLVVLALCLGATRGGRAETGVLYTLVVPHDGVVLRSGPGASFYATDRLKTGMRLDVYRESPDGWLAIRPPAGSFSLVERRQLKRGDEAGVAAVRTDGTLACVGSSVETVQAYVSQVRLQKGELVELLDAWKDAPSEADAQSDDPAWCRISPAAGEFRWVRADDLKPDAQTASRPRPQAAAASPKPDAEIDTSPVTGPPSAKSSFEADGWVRVDRENPSDRSQTSQSPTFDSAPRAEPTPRSEMTPDGTRDAQAAPTATQPATSAAAAPTTSPPSAPQPTARARPTQPVARLDSDSVIMIPAAATAGAAETARPAPATAPMSNEDRWSSRTPPPRQSIQELETDLALMVAQDARTWRLAELRRRVEANLVRFGTTDERVQARRLLDRIGEFEQLTSRLGQVQTPSGSVASAPVGSAPATSPEPLASSAPPAAAPAVVRTDAARAGTDRSESPTEIGEQSVAGDVNTVKYDGSGWLVPVHSTTGTAPPFALLDAQGEVLGYVSPTPGLNLQRYVRQQVGIFGIRGYVPALNKPHVTAERIVELDRRLR